MLTEIMTMTVAQYIDGTVEVPEDCFAEFLTPMGQWPIVHAERTAQGPVITVDDLCGGISLAAFDNDVVHITRRSG